MFCLMEGRHVHPSTLYPGGVGHRGDAAAVHRLPQRGCCGSWTSSRRPSPMNDDVFDFFYEALPGYEEVGRRRILLGCWGAFNNPDHVDYTYQQHGRLGQRDVRHPGRRRRRRAGDDEPRRHQPRHPHPARQLLLRGLGRARRRSSTKDPLGNPVDKRHPWNQTTIPKPQKRDLDGGNYSWVMSPRWYDKRTGDHLALDTGGGAARAAVGDGAGEQGRHAVREGDRARAC